MKKIAVISAILEAPAQVQQSFNQIVGDYQSIVKGRMGLPLAQEGVAVISITVIGETDEINAFTGKLGALPHVTIKTAISKRDF